MRLWIGILFLCVCGWAGNEVGGNGDHLSAWFVALAHHVVLEVERLERLGTPLSREVSAQALREALKTRVVVVDEKNAALITNRFGEVKDIKVVRDETTKEWLVLLDRATWTAFYEKQSADYRVVFHAYLYLAGVDDQDYHVSALLQLTPPTPVPLAVFTRRLSLTSLLEAPGGGYFVVEKERHLQRLDANGVPVWVQTQAEPKIFRYRLIPLRDGDFLAVGKISRPIKSPGAITMVYHSLVERFSPAGGSRWVQEYCLALDRDKYCQDQGVIDGRELPDGSLQLVANTGQSDRSLPGIFHFGPGYGYHSHALVHRLAADGRRLPGETRIEDAEIDSLVATRDGGALLAGVEHHNPDRKLLKTGDYRLLLVRLDASGRAKWRKEKGPGRRGRALELPDGGIALAGSKVLGVTQYPDLIQEPTLWLLGADGETRGEHRLYFADPTVEDRRYMGQTGAVGSLQLAADGTLWVSGGNNIFERKEPRFYYNNDSLQLNERNGFVFRFDLRTGAGRHRLYPGSASLLLLRNADGSVVLGGDRFFSKVVGSEF